MQRTTLLLHTIKPICTLHHRRRNLFMVHGYSLKCTERNCIIFKSKSRRLTHKSVAMKRLEYNLDLSADYDRTFRSIDRYFRQTTRQPNFINTCLFDVWVNFREYPCTKAKRIQTTRLFCDTKLVIL